MALGFCLEEAGFTSLTTGVKAITKLRKKNNPVPLLQTPRQRQAPPPDRLRQRWIFAVGFYAVLVFFLSVAPVVQGKSPVSHVDKLAHFCVYLVFAWLLVRTIQLCGGQAFEYLILAWLFATSYGLLMELIQAMLPWRQAELADVAVNALGAALGVWLAERMFPKIS